MKEKTADEQKGLFLNLMMMLGSSAMQQLGQIPGQEENTQINLEGAQMMIDMLSMLEIKTAGNLDDDEAKLLKDTLASLQMAYVTAANQQGQTHADKASEPKTNAPQAHIQPEPAAQESPERHEPKFHKSYGS